MIGSQYFRVSELNNLIKAKFDEDPDFGSVFLKGEVSNFKVYASGHGYFSLKDDKSVISAVMWADSLARLAFLPKDGDEVIVHGRVTSYPARGAYQIYCDSMELFGQGAELLRIQELKKKMAAEGLFDVSKKRQINRFPSKIGIITAKGSAAIKDMVVNIQNRYPLVDIVVFPSLVQGKEAPAELLRAFQASQNYDLDTLIIGRGGGSSEDLGAFNDESLVRAVAKSKCPTISAVGHEIDTTLLDYVADVRVSTPTAAAVAAVVDKNDIYQNLDDDSSRLNSALALLLRHLKETFFALKNRSFFKNPSLIYKKRIDDIGVLSERLKIAARNDFESRQAGLRYVKGHLLALNPYGVLDRGYSITEDYQGNLITSVSQAKIGVALKTKVKDGIIHSTITNKEADKDGRN